MPQLLAPDDLLPLATPLWQRLAPAWTVEIVRVKRASLGGADGLTSANTTTSRARIVIADDLVGEELRKTLGHEIEHVNWWPVTELLDHADPRTLALIEPIVERSGLAASFALARMNHLAARNLGLFTPAALAREGDDCMDDIALILAALRAALTSADIAAAVQALVDEIAGMLPADAAAVEEPIAGETAPMMMRRGIAKVLARKAAPVVDALGPKVLRRLGASTDTEGLMKLELALVAVQAAGGIVAADDVRERKAVAVATMKRAGLGRPAFYVDGVDELLPVWREGTLDEMKRTCASIASGGATLARPRVTPGPSDEAGLAERARQSGMSVEARRASEANVNRGAAAAKES